jgi:hypothetical protein
VSCVEKMGQNERGGNSNTGKMIPELPGGSGRGRGYVWQLRTKMGLNWMGIHVHAKFTCPSKQTFFFLFLS